MQEQGTRARTVEGLPNNSSLSPAAMLPDTNNQTAA